MVGMLVLMVVIAVLVVFVLQLQQVQHFLYHSLKGSPQLLAAVRLPQWRYVYEGRSPMSKVQRRVVGVVTQIPGEGSNDRCEVMEQWFYCISTFFEPMWKENILFKKMLPQNTINMLKHQLNLGMLNRNSRKFH